MHKRTPTLSKSASAALALAGAVTIFCGSAQAASMGDGAYKGGFTISGDRVTPDSTFTARVRILGAQITYGGQYDIPVTFGAQIGNQTLEHYGSINSPTTANVNDGEYPKDWVLTDTFRGGTSIRLMATSWIKARSRYDGSRDSHWRNHMTVNTASSTPQVMTLRNGDTVPSITPFMGQNGINRIVRDYIDPTTGRVHLHDNEIIYLFELGTRDTDSAAADFQDLVVLVTLAENPSYFEEPEVPRTLTVVFD